MEQLFDMSMDTRHAIFEKWVESLYSDFVMLNYELGLVPISAVVRLFNDEKGEFVQNALELLLRGNLKYSRKRNSPRPSSGDGIRIQTARRYLPPHLKSIIARMNQTARIYEETVNAETEQIRRNNEPAQREHANNLREHKINACENTLGVGNAICQLLLSIRELRERQALNQ